MSGREACRRHRIDRRVRRRRFSLQACLSCALGSSRQRNICEFWLFPHARESVAERFLRNTKRSWVLCSASWVTCSFPVTPLFSTLIFSSENVTNQQYERIQKYRVGFGRKSDKIILLFVSRDEHNTHGRWREVGGVQRIKSPF